MMTDRQRFEVLMPFYVNGTLSAADKAFVQAYLAKHDQAQASLGWTSNIQQAIKDLTSEQPDEKRVSRFLDKVAGQQTGVVINPVSKHQPDPTGGLKVWWLALTGLGSAVLAATLVLIPGFFPTGVLHWDQLDGRPDVQLTLADNVSPSDPQFLASLEQHGCQVLGQTQADGHYQLLVDLKNRAHNQHALIKTLKDQGQLESYTLLASR